MLYTQPHTRGHDIMHFCGEIYRVERLEGGKKELAPNGMWILRMSCCIVTQNTAPRLCWTVFLQEKKWFVLRQRVVSDHMPHFHPFLLPHWEIQSTPLPPYSSMFTCWNSFKSSTHCFAHLAGDYQHAPWCNTPTENLLCSICSPDTKTETLRAQWLPFP